MNVIFVFVYKLIFIAFISLSAFRLNAHQYFFAFAEVEYNQMQEYLEGTLILSAHDLEEALMQNGIINTKFEKYGHDSLSIAAIGQELFSDFKFNYQGTEIKLNALDFSLTKNGLFEFYFKSDKIKLEKEFELEFSNLMNEFPQQQNKITFIYNGNKQTASFLNDKRKQKLTIE